MSNKNIKEVLRVNFNHIDFKGTGKYVNHVFQGCKTIGIVKAGTTIEQVVLVVDEIFDNELTFSIGDDKEHTRLMQQVSEDLHFDNKFLEESDYVYEKDTEIKIYYTGKPSVGKGRVIVYLD